MKTTTETYSVQSATVLPGEPQVNQMGATITAINGNPEGVEVSFLGQLKTNENEGVVKITMPSTTEVSGASPSRQDPDQANVSMNGSGKSSGPAYVGVTLNVNLSNSDWDFDLLLDYGSANQKKYKLKKM